MTEETHEPTPLYVAIAAGPRTVHTGLGSYDGKELRDYDGRPGAMDAFRLPSLMGEYRTVPHGRGAK